MEKAVHIMESYVYGLIESREDIVTPQRQNYIQEQSDDMFIDVAKHTEGAIAYYFRFSSEVSHSKCGFYRKVKGEEDFIRFETTDLSLYDKDDNEHDFLRRAVVL